MAMQLYDENVNSIPASLIRQYIFCPRIPFYHEVLNIYPAERFWQRQGVEFHQRESMLMKRRNLQQFGINNPVLQHNVHLHSQQYGMHGICDAVVISENEICVLEFKIARSDKPQKGHVMQLAAYALMAEEQLQLPCRHLFILYGDKGKTHHITFTAELKKELLGIIENIRSSLEKPLLPHSPATEAQCGQCEYLNFCADRQE